MIVQDALAEAVDGENSGLVEARDGDIQLAHGARDIACFQELRDNQIARFAAPQIVERIAQARAHAVAQFLGRGDGVSHRENSPDQEVLLDHEPQHDAGERVGFARAGARLDERDAALQRRVGELEFDRFFHASASFPSIGKNTSPASCANSAPIGSLSPKQNANHASARSPS